MRRLLTVLRIGCGLLTALLILAVLLLAWLLSTTIGLRTALDIAGSVSGGALRVEQAEGRVLGGFELQGLRLEAGGHQVAVDRLLLDWSPGWLPAATLRIAALHADGVRVELAPPVAEAEPEAAAAPLELDVSLPGRLRIDDLRLRDILVAQAGATVVELDEVGLRARAGGRRIRIDQLWVQHPQFGAYQLQARLHTPPQRLRIVELALTGPGRLSLQGELPLRFDAEAPDATLDLAWTDLHWPPQGPRQFESAHGQARLRGPLLRPELHAELLLGSLDVPAGEVTLDAHWRGEDFDLRAGWTDLLDPLAPTRPTWRSARGELLAGGRIDAWQAQLDAEAEVQGLPAALRLRAQGDLAQAEVETLRLDLFDGHAEIAGALRWSPALAGGFDLRLSGLDPAPLAAGFPGRLNGEARLDLDAGGDGAPAARLRLRIADSQLRGYPLAARIDASWRDAVAEVAQADLRSGDSRLQLRGRVTPPFAATARLDSPDLAALAPGLAGALTLDISADGELPRLHLRAQGEAAGLAAGTLRIETVRLDADLDLAGATRLDLALDDLHLGMPVDSVRLALDGEAARHVLRVDSHARDSRFILTAEGGVDVEALRWQGRIADLAFEPGDIGEWRLQAPAALTAGREGVSLAPLCLAGGGGRSCAEGELIGGDGYAAFSVQALALGYFQPFLPPGLAIEGEVDGSGDLLIRGGAPGRADVALEVSRGHFSLPGAPSLRFGPGRVYAEGDVKTGIDAGIDLAIDAGLLTGRAQLGAAGAGGVMPLSGDVLFDLPNLDFLPVFATEVLEASGQVSGGLRLAGDTARPAFTGELALADGRIRLDTPGLTLEAVQARLHAGADGRLRLDADLRSGDGALTVGGDVDFADGRPRADIRVQGDRFQAANLPEVRLWVTPDLRIVYDEALRISGSVQVPEAMIEPQKFSGGGGVTASRDQVIVVDGREVDDIPAGLPVHAEVTVVLGDAVRLEGYGLKTRLGGRLTVIESPGRLTRGRGELRLEEGQYKAYGQDLTIERGRLIFDSGPVTEPGLDFRAVRRPRRDVMVGVEVRGTLEAPAFQLFSEPPMQQDAQLSWLVLGRPPPSGGSQGEDQALLAAAALALGLRGGDWLAGRIGGGIGLDEISVGSEPGEDASQARLTVGKYIGSRLYVSYGVGLFQPGHIYRLRYDLGRGFALQAETGVHSGGDLLYTIERGAPPPLPGDDPG